MDASANHTINKYAEVRNRAAEFTRLEQQMRAGAIEALRTELTRQIFAAGFSLAGVFPNAKPKQADARVVGERKPAKYRDPDTGKTWCGVGKRPGWLKGVEDLTPYAI